MPLSHRYRAIFIHIPKCGGSSIEKALGVFGEKNDGDLKLSKDMLFGVSGNRALQHLTLAEIKKRVPADVFKSYFKFAFVRNPFDRLVSEYHWRISEKMIEPSLTFKEFIRRVAVPFKKTRGPARLFKDRRELIVEDHFIAQHEFVTDETGRVAVDKVGRMENFERDFKGICLAIGAQAELPSINRTAHKPYTELYDSESRGWVEQLYKKDLELFNYVF